MASMFVVVPGGILVLQKDALWRMCGVFRLNSCVSSVSLTVGAGMFRVSRRVDVCGIFFCSESATTGTKAAVAEFPNSGQRGERDKTRNISRTPAGDTKECIGKTASSSHLSAMLSLLSSDERGACILNTTGLLLLRLACTSESQTIIMTGRCCSFVNHLSTPDYYDHQDIDWCSLTKRREKDSRPKMSRIRSAPRVFCQTP